MMSSTTTEKANLARIRDNQRRSRARRKEYLQELETKLRQCEHIGVEASTEIQTAAKRVASENRRLRELLIRSGVREDDIEQYLNHPPPTESMNDQYHARSSGEALEQMIQTRKPCCPGNNKNSCGPVGRKPSRDDDDRIMPQDQFVPEGEMMSSSSSNFTTPSDISSQFSQTSMEQGQHGFPQQQQQQQRLSPLIQHNLGIPTSAPIPTFHEAQVSGFNPSVSMQNNDNDHNNASNQFATGHDMTGNHVASTRPQQISIAPMPTLPSSGNVNSCNFAADMITSMAGGDPAAVRADLGCLPGMECDVDNQLVFQVMDQYSNSSGMQ